MTSIKLLFGHTGVAMGQQLHERWLQSALVTALHPDLDVVPLIVRPWRAMQPASGGDGVRIPVGLTTRLPITAQRLVTRVAYGRADLYHRFDLRLPPAPGREVLTVHDLPGLHFPDEGSIGPSLLRSATRSRGVICPSQFAADEIWQILKPRNVWVIPNGVSPHISTTDAWTSDRVRAVGIDRPFILHAGGSTLRKNLVALGQAWRLVTEAVGLEVLLVQCGPPSAARTSSSAGVPNVLHLGHLPPSDVAGLMKAAQCVIVPSLYEGFGLPALEGMACGVPVVASNTGALPEVCADAAFLVEPTAAGLAEGLIAALTDESLRAELRKRGPVRAAEFTWDRAGALHRQAYEELLS